MSDTFKKNIRLEACLLLPITVCEIAITAVILTVAKNENLDTPLRVWIVGYLGACVASPLVILTGYFVQNLIVDNTIQGFRSEDSADHIHCVRENERIILRLVFPLEVIKLLFKFFYFVWFVVGCVWVIGGSSSRHTAPRLYWSCVVLLVYRGTGYARLFITMVTIAFWFTSGFIRGYNDALIEEL